MTIANSTSAAPPSPLHASARRALCPREPRDTGTTSSAAIEYVIVERPRKGTGIPQRVVGSCRNAASVVRPLLPPPMRDVSPE